MYVTVIDAPVARSALYPDALREAIDIARETRAPSVLLYHWPAPKNCSCTPCMEGGLDVVFHYGEEIRA